MPLGGIVPLVADLMSVPLPEDRYPASEMTPPQKREAMLDAIAGWLFELAESKPVLQVPSPEELAFKEDTVKVTIALSKTSIDFFKKKAAENNTAYQKMIRRLLDSYVNRHTGV
jgi:hypothetical protein